MALVKGRFVDKTIPIQSDNDPVDLKDLARKGYVDSQAASAADAKVEDQIVNGVTAKAPSQNAVFDALANKVTGPASATDNAIARFDGTTGKLVQNSGITISDADLVVVPTGGDVRQNSRSAFKSFGAAFSYTGDNLTGITYSSDSSSKVLTYTLGVLTRVDHVLSDRTIRKDFNYTLGKLTSITESVF
jgi:hypothetical protein